MTEAPTLAELLAVAVVLFGLGLSCWALVDDTWDLYHVYRFGEVGGPRWVAANEHFLFNGTLLVGWLLMLGLVAIAVYLPTRTDQPTTILTDWAGWLRFGFMVAVLMAQTHRRIGRQKLRNLPLESWERMLASMFDGLTVAERESLSHRLLAATTAGREMGHLIANRLTAPVGLIDLVLVNAVGLTAEQRADLEEAREHILAVSDSAAGLHAAIKAQESAP